MDNKKIVLQYLGKLWQFFSKFFKGHLYFKTLQSLQKSNSYKDFLAWQNTLYSIKSDYH